jgi:pimeloyl-ACP methyl ester carboxylesterase
MRRNVLELPNKIKLSYLEWNQGKEPLILLHGLADHGLVWSNLGDFLSENYHIIAPDLRGHGESSKPKTGYTFAEIIEDLEGLLKHLNLSKINVIGHSWGGKLAAIWATQNPDLFKTLVLVDPFFIDKMPSWFELTFPILYQLLPFLKMLGPFPDYQTAEKLAKSLKQYQGWSELQQKVFQTGMEQKPDGKWGSKFVIQARNETFIDVMKVAGLTKNLDIPTLFIKPQKGLNRSEFQLKPYKKYLTNLQIQEVPGNHWPFLVEPDSFNQAIAFFLSTLHSYS